MKQIEALKILKSGRNVFLTGEPGSGKTYTINLFAQWLRENYRGFAVTASTGIAATHINGVTIHSWSGLGIKETITDEHVSNIIENKDFLVRKIRSAGVLIIDEISMLSGNTIDNIDKILRGVRTEFMQESKPFGGLQVIFVGDFFQLPPVDNPISLDDPEKKREKPSFAFESEAWKDADPVVCYLTEQHRQRDGEFLNILTAMRNGEVTEEHKKALLHQPEIEPKTKLFTHNAEVDRINTFELAKIEEKPEIYTMTSGGNQYLVDILKKNCLSPERLVLKKGAVVMFTRNNFDVGYVNGTLGTVIDFKSDYPIVETNDGRHIYVDHAEWSVDDGRAWVKQIPLRLAWAITVHKSQGMSLDAARIDLSKTFEYGQGYVAISRVRTLSGLYLEGANDKAFMMHPKIVEMDKEFRRLSGANI